MTDEEMFKAGFRAGFDVTRDGWNGACAYVHCAEGDDLPDNVEEAIEVQADRAWQALQRREVIQ